LFRLKAQNSISSGAEPTLAALSQTLTRFLEEKKEMNRNKKGRGRIGVEVAASGQNPKLLNPEK